MDCPGCGLLNPPDAAKCDCGYSFETGEHSATPGWPIELSWSQRLAAYWSISWPASVASFSIGFLLTSIYPFEELGNHLRLITLGSNLSYFAIQALIARRLVRKKYRSFRVGVLRDGKHGGTLSMLEAIQVWLWIFGPQLALFLTTSLIVWWFEARLTPASFRSVSSLSLWLRLLVAGPYGVDLALRAHYSGFRLQAFGHR